LEDQGVLKPRVSPLEEDLERELQQGGQEQRDEGMQLEEKEGKEEKVGNEVKEGK
jgi:hypothetical protein